MAKIIGKESIQQFQKKNESHLRKLKRNLETYEENERLQEEKKQDNI